ncbi:TEX14 kinase, partial [Pitta sordida]|nr:TEX14 kinase [Pitta sordida]
GVFVDAVNSMGQTSLFIAALLGLGKIVNVLLDYGSNPNHRCSDGSTPVHAAAFSGNPWILSQLLDKGADLRAHDQDGRTPQCWALSARKENSAQVLEFIQQCTLHMQAALQNFPSSLLRRFGSSKTLLCSPSRFGGLVQGKKEEAKVAKSICSFGRDGFGELLHVPCGYALFQFCLAGNGHLGYLASLPIIGEEDVVQADDEPAFSYPVGPHMVMTNLVWGGCRVTVKELSLQPPLNSWKLRWADLLRAEQEHSSKLHHPHLLQLMSVCLSSDLEKTRLVYERVHFGSLYSILHERRTEFPVLQTETIVHILLQVNDALRFLHSRGFIHRSISSFAIQIVSPGNAKLCNLEYMIQSKDRGEHSDLTRIPVPVQLHRWSSPEVILEKAATVKSDVYSFCAVLQETWTESPPWQGFEDSVIKQLIISGQQLKADVRLPLLCYDVVKSGLEPKQRKRSIKLQDIQYILRNYFKDLVKSQSGRAGEMSRAQRCAVFADVNICCTSAFSCLKRSVEFQEKETTKAGGPTAPRDSVFPEEKRALMVQEPSASQQPVAQDKSCNVPSEFQKIPSESDGDESLRSFEINEIFASYPEAHEGFLEGGSGLGQTQKDEKRPQNEGHESPLGALSMSSGASCEDEEEGDSSGSGSELSTGREESEASDLGVLAKGKGDAGRRGGSSPDRTEQYISKCVLDVTIMHSMLQQAADSLGRTEEKLDKLKLLQENKMNRFSKQSFQRRHWNRSDDPSQSTKNPSGVNIFLHKAVGPSSSVYIPPQITCQAQGKLGGDVFQPVSKTAKEIQAIQNDKWKNKTENNHHDFGCSVGKALDDQVRLNHEVKWDIKAGCQKKFHLQCQRGADSHPAARSEGERWCSSKPRCEFYGREISEERGMMQSEWGTEVKQMARRVASGWPDLSCPASEGTSESEAESTKETFQHVTTRAPKSQAQRRCKWQPGDDVELRDLGSEDGTESEKRDLESALRRSRGRSCQSPAQDEQAESGIAIPKNSVLPQQVENLSIGCSRSLGSPSDVYEEFFTPDYFPFPAIEGSSGQEVKIAENTLAIRGKIPFCSPATQKCGSNKLGVNQVSQMPVTSVDAAREARLWEPQEECQEKDVSVADIQDLSSIPCEQENSLRDVECRTPRVSHAPTSVSTPLGSEPKIPLAFEEYKNCHELASDFSLCGSQEASSTMFNTFTTAYEEERSVEIPGAAPRVCPLEFKEPVSSSRVLNEVCKQDAIKVFFPPLSQHSESASEPSIDELLDEIEHLEKQHSISPDSKETGLQDFPDQIKMENRESEKECERNQSVWTEESFTLAEDTERAHSTLDDALERMLHAGPGDEEIQEQ